MKLTKTSVHASLAMAQLARLRGHGFVQARTLAEHLQIPTDSALKILQALARNGVIESRLGRGGGYRMSQSPQRISLLSIIEAIEGPITAGPAIDGAFVVPSPSVETLASICRTLADQVRDHLATISVEQLAYASPAPIPVEAT